MKEKLIFTFVMLVLFPFALKKWDNILNLIDVFVIFASSIIFMKQTSLFLFIFN